MEGESTSTASKTLVRLAATTIYASRAIPKDTRPASAATGPATLMDIAPLVLVLLLPLDPVEALPDVPLERLAVEVLLWELTDEVPVEEAPESDEFELVSM